jgi:hypothetical protein
MIYIVVRRTTEWEHEPTFRAQIPAGFDASVDLWNATFTIPYHVFRHRLKAIAQLSWSRVSRAVRVARTEVPPGALAVPTDDDDWFAPHLADVLACAVDGRYAGYSWPSKFIEVPTTWRHEIGVLRRKLFPRTPLKMVCTTNNYAVVVRPETAPLLDNHLHATRWFIDHAAMVKRLEEPLSVMNRSLASRTSLWPTPSRAALIRKYRRYRRLYQRRLAPELAWCHEYYEQLRDLMQQLQLRA